MNKELEKLIEKFEKDGWIVCDKDFYPKEEFDLVLKYLKENKQLKEIVEKIKKESKHHAHQYCNCSAHRAIQILLAKKEESK